MRKLRVGVIDVVANSPSTTGYARVMRANLAAIMPQVIGVWCEEAGHEVHLAYHAGHQNMIEELPGGLDIVFIGTFTTAAHVAYALSKMYQAKGCVTVLGGPHARSYPEDAQKYFDYVVGFANREIIRDILSDCEEHRPLGRQLAAPTQPESLPGVEERWKFAEMTLAKSPLIKIVPMIGSLGCPYTCSFCIDSEVPYQPLDFEVLSNDLRFLQTKFKRPIVGWHDPNFGVRFDDYLDAIEDAVPAGSVDFVAESSLSLLKEDHLKRLQKNGFKAILPGIESWFDLGNKSKTGKSEGLEKVHQVSEHIELIAEYIPYLQANFVLGLDSDFGEAPFELTKRFVDLSPGAFPGYSLLSAFGRAAPLNLEYQRNNRVLPFPFHFLNNNHAMNVKPANYSWPDFYDHVIDLTRYTFSWRAIARRFRAVRTAIPRWMNVVRAVSSEGFGRLKYYREIRRRLDEDMPLRRYFEGETTDLPAFFHDRVKRDLGPLWKWLPEGALFHDANAYLHAEGSAAITPLTIKASSPTG